jgi:hypothetical protein
MSTRNPARARAPGRAAAAPGTRAAAARSRSRVPRPPRPCVMVAAYGNESPPTGLPDRDPGLARGLGALVQVTKSTVSVVPQLLGLGDCENREELKLEPDGNRRPPAGPPVGIRVAGSPPGIRTRIRDGCNALIPSRYASEWCLIKFRAA